jgi:hypothetical protein
MRGIERWRSNRALAEYYAGKQLRVGGDGRVTYTDSENWCIQHSPEVQRRNSAEWAQLQEESRRRREELFSRMDAVRQKAIRIGLATPADVDRIIHDLPFEEFRRDFGEFHVSRAFFKCTE